MKKRILSLLLACVLVFSALPMISHPAEISATENITSISSYADLVNVLTAGESTSVSAQLASDIAVPAESEPVGGFNVSDFHLDGKGFSIKGLKVKDALFASLTNSSVRNITFDSVSVETTATAKTPQMALVAQSMDKNSKVTSCVFENCVINLPDFPADAAFVATENKGTITNCVVKETSVIKNPAGNNRSYLAGGITAENLSGSAVINCESKVQFELNSTVSDYAGITADNSGKIDLCYADSQYSSGNPVAVYSSSINNSVYKNADGSFTLGKTKCEKLLQVMVADMSQNVMNYISANYKSSLSNQADFPALWRVDGDEPALSFDINIAQVFLKVESNLDDADVSFSLGAVEDLSSSGRWFSVPVGEYKNGEYVRNKVDVSLTLPKDSLQMVNSFVYSPSYSFMEDIINPHDGNNYSKQLIPAFHNENVNTASFELLPYSWNLSLTNVDVDDELVAYEFSGKGTEQDPYLIRSEFEFDVFLKYVHDETDLGKKYRKAYYKLATDLSDITMNPIGDDINPFTGGFDGGAHVISNLKVIPLGDKSNYVGFFGYVLGTADSPAVIKNLNIINANVETEGDICGVAVGQANYAVINGCVTSGVVSGGTQISGVVGYAHNSQIYNCGSTADINTLSPNASAGGVVAYSENTNVRNSYYSGTIKNYNVVKAHFIKTGGITGYVEGSRFSNCFCNVIDNGDRVLFDTGIKGVSSVSADYLKSEDFLKNISDYSIRAGFGTFWGEDKNSVNQGYPVIALPEDMGLFVICVSTEAGKLIADNTKPKAGDTITLTVDSEHELLEIKVTNLNRETVDIYVEKNHDGTYSFIMPAYSVRVVPVFDAEVHLSGMGTKEDPYIVSNFAELSLMSDKCYYNKPVREEGCVAYPWAYYELANDIDCDNQILRPMGNRYYPFNGHFDGEGYTVSNLIPKATDEQVSHDYAYPAIFGYCGSAEIHNVTFEGIKLSGSRAAVVASTVWGNTDIYNVTLRNCTFDNVDGAGGFVSQGIHTRIVNCHADNLTFTNAKDSAYVIASVLKSIYINNILVENSGGVSKMIKGSNAAITVEDYTNYYSCNTDISDETYINQSLINKVDESKLTDREFIAEVSENAYYINLNYTFNDFNFWGLGDKIELAHENGVVGILPIHYTEEFDDPKAAELFIEKVNASEIGQTVEIKCNQDVDLRYIKLTTPTNRNVGFSIGYNKNGEYVISFVMPEEPVIISNSGIIPDIEFIPGTGTFEDPYRVSIPQHIMLISEVTNGFKTQYKDIPEDVDYINAQFILMNDIDMSAFNWTYPIGNSEVPFTGVFDGKNFTISNLNSNSTPASSFGLFGTAQGATFKNIKLADISYILSGKADFDIGGLCGNVVGNVSNAHAFITDCYVDGVISVDDCDSIGGICGKFWHDNIGVVRCITNCEISVIWAEYIGGIVGMTKGHITNCAATGPILAQGSDFGGISGGDFSDDYTISGCYFSGSVEGSFRRWGEISPNSKACVNCYYLEDAYNVYANEHYSNSVEKSLAQFVSGEVTYLLNSGVTGGTQAWYQNIDNGLTPEDFPHFDKHATNTVYKVDRADAVYSNLNFKDGIYEISNPLELIAFSAYVNSGNPDADAIVVADIDMTGYEFTPIGQTGLYYQADPQTGESKGYEGDFDGQGFVISNLTVKGSSANDLSYGLFGTVSGKVQNIGLENFKYIGNGKDSRVGAVAGQVLKNGKIIDCYAKNVDINTQINTTNGVAGSINGANYAGEVLNCYSYNVKITAGRTGGIVADNFGDGNNSDGTDRPGKVENCYTDYGNICGRGTAAGGLCNVKDSTFKSGEIVYKLLDNRAEALWRQGSDKLPALKGDVIYKNICKDEEFYSTIEGDFESHIIDHNKGEVRCQRCNHFDSATLVTDDNYKALGLTADYVGMYAVKNASNMYWISEKNAENPIRNGVVLLEDITIDSSIEEWIPMFVDYTDFTFDGRGHTLTINLDFGSEQKSADLALFSTFNYGFIKDLVIKGSVTANTTANVGSLAGSAYRSTFERVISYVDVTNNCETGGRAGGLAGYYGGQMDTANGYFSRILNCAVYADVKGCEAGGIVGHGWNGKQYYDIRNSAFVGDVTGITYQGAIIGYHGNNQDAYHCTFKDIYYLEKDGLGFSGGGNTNYTLDITVTDKTQAQFESGEVAYLLNNGKTDSGIWKQNIDNGKEKDALPVHIGGTVYKNTTCIDEFIEYSNTKDEVVHDYNNYYVCKKCIGLYPGKIAGIWGFDLGLSGSIELNYYMVIDEEVSKDPTARMVFTVPGGSKSDPDATYEVSVPLSEAQFDGTFYYFSCGIPAKEMCSDIYCKLVTDTKESDSFRYSVKEYAEYILANPEGNEDAIPLIKSILNYGAYAQIELEHKTDNLANTSQFITEDEKQLPEVNFQPYERVIVGEQKGVSFYGSMLTHLTTTNIRLFFDFENPKDVETLEITVNGKKVVPVKNGSYYEVLIEGTPAQAYHLNHVVKIGDMTLYYNVFSYGASVQKNGGKTETLNLCKSMYVYNQEVIKFLEK